MVKLHLAHETWQQPLGCGSHGCPITPCPERSQLTLHGMTGKSSPALSAFVRRRRDGPKRIWGPPRSTAPASPMADPTLDPTSRHREGTYDTLTRSDSEKLSEN